MDEREQGGDQHDSEPAAPPAGELLLYARSIAGRMFPKWVGPSGLDNPIQEALWANMISAWFPGSTTTVDVWGGAVTSVGTISHPALAVTNLKTRTRRFLNTSASAAGSLASSRPSVTACSRETGFFYVFRGGLSTLAAGMRWFAGLTNGATAVPTNVDPLTSTASDKVGLAVNASTGNLQLIHNTNAAAPTVIDLGANYPVNTTNIYELILFCAPGASQITWRVRVNLSATNEQSGTITTNLPVLASLMERQIWACNNATAASVAWDCSRCYVMTDN